MHHVRPTFSIHLAGSLLVALCVAAAEDEVPTIQFNRDIRPILAENCFYCHGQDGNKRKADLRLDDQRSAHAKVIRKEDGADG